MRDAGVPLPVRNGGEGIVGERFCFFSFHAIVGDEAALKAIFDCKGAAGLRVCMRCKNVVAEGALLSLKHSSAALFRFTIYV